MSEIKILENLKILFIIIVFVANFKHIFYILSRISLTEFSSIGIWNSNLYVI